MVPLPGATANYSNDYFWVFRNRDKAKRTEFTEFPFVSPVFIKMFGVVTCTLAASNFLYCDFGAETPVAALGVVCPPPPQQFGLGRESSREHALWTWPCSPWLVQPTVLCLHCRMSTFVTEFPCSGNMTPLGQFGALLHTCVHGQMPACGTSSLWLVESHLHGQRPRRLGPFLLIRFSKPGHWGM